MLTYYNHRHTGCCFGTFIPMCDASSAVSRTITDLASGAWPYIFFAPPPLPSAIYLLIPILLGRVGAAFRSQPRA